MKFRTTQKAIRNGYCNVIAIGYCNTQTLLHYENPIAYTTRLEGWGCDIYEITPNTAIATGYAPFGNIRPKYEITRAYEEKAQTILYDYSKPFETRRDELRNLLNEFVKEVTK